jgi:hypothetical protein
VRQLVLAIIVLATPPALAAGRSGTPPRPPPRLHQQGPPPAWVETQSQSLWLAFSSYCWSHRVGDNRAAICADMMPPQSRTDLPALNVTRGRPLRFHLAFLPREVHLTLFHPTSFSHYILKPKANRHMARNRQRHPVAGDPVRLRVGCLPRAPERALVDESPAPAALLRYPVATTAVLLAAKSDRGSWEP